MIAGWGKWVAEDCVGDSLLEDWDAEEGWGGHEGGVRLGDDGQLRWVDGKPSGYLEEVEVLKGGWEEDDVPEDECDVIHERHEGVWDAVGLGNVKARCSGNMLEEGFDSDHEEQA